VRERKDLHLGVLAHPIDRYCWDGLADKDLRFHRTLSSWFEPAALGRATCGTVGGILDHGLLRWRSIMG
jgi:hypothetical protein